MFVSLHVDAWVVGNVSITDGEITYLIEFLSTNLDIDDGEFRLCDLVQCPVFPGPVEGSIIHDIPTLTIAVSWHIRIFDLLAVPLYMK